MGGGGGRRHGKDLGAGVTQKTLGDGVCLDCGKKPVSNML